jgi:hypothetical protein
MEASVRAATRGDEQRPPLALTPPGVVEVTRIDDQWWCVAIGRERGPKRFNVTRGEAAELVRVLRERMLTLDGGES